MRRLRDLLARRRDREHEHEQRANAGPRLLEAGFACRHCGFKFYGPLDGGVPCPQCRTEADEFPLRKHYDVLREHPEGGFILRCHRHAHEWRMCRPVSSKSKCPLGCRLVTLRPRAWRGDWTTDVAFDGNKKAQSAAEN